MRGNFVGGSRGPLSVDTSRSVRLAILAVLSLIFLLPLSTSLVNWDEWEEVGLISYRVVFKVAARVRSDLQSEQGLSLEGLEPQQLMMPLEDVRNAFKEGRATLFLLRVMKTGSTGMQYLFSTRKREECSPHLDLDLKETVRKEMVCSRLFKLLQSATHDESCQDMRSWEDPAEWSQLDCLPHIGGPEYEDKFYQLPQNEQDRVRTAFRKSRIVSGHFSYGLHRIGHRGVFTYVTQLREPISRVVSHVNHNLRNNQGPLKERSWEDLILDPIWLRFMKNNHQTRLLCNEGTRGLYGAVASMSGPFPEEELSEVHYRCALSHLRTNFALVFVTEQLYQVYPVASTVARVFDLRVQDPEIETTTYTPTIFDNSTIPIKSSSEISDEIRDFLVRMNKWDILLYKEAQILHKISVERLQRLADKEALAAQQNTRSATTAELTQ